MLALTRARHLAAARRNVGSADLGLRLHHRPHVSVDPSAWTRARTLAARASKKDDGDKSWGEILDEAAGVAKSVFNKIKDTATSLVPGSTTSATSSSDSQQSAKPATTSRPEAPIAPTMGGGLLPNLLGRAVGGLLSAAVSQLGAQLEAAAKEQAGVYEEAAARLQGSAKLRSRLGIVTVGPLMSQSSSSSSINGVVTKQIMLVMPVYGSGGGAGTAQVSVVEGPQQQRGGPGRNMQITVRTSDGGVIMVDDGGGAGGTSGRGSVIDVEFREVDSTKK